MEAFKGFLQQCQEFLLAFGQTLWSYLSDPWIASGIALVLLVLVFVFFWSKKQPSRIRAFTNGNGYVEISRAALVDIIRSKSEQVDIEKKPGVSIRTRRGKLHVDVRIRLLPSRRLAEVSDILQQHLKEALEEGLGIRKLGSINVLVIGVRVVKGKEARKSLPLNPQAQEIDEKSSEAEPEPAPFVVVDESKDGGRSSERKQRVVEHEEDSKSSPSDHSKQDVSSDAGAKPDTGVGDDSESESIKRENGKA